MAYVFLASPNAGTLNVWLDALFGVKPFNVHTMTGMIFVSALFLYSFVFLAVEGALATIDSGYEEAARVAGASRWTVVRRVTLPLITPSLAAAGVLVRHRLGLFATPAISACRPASTSSHPALSALNSFPKLGRRRRSPSSSAWPRCSWRSACGPSGGRGSPAATR
jgi:ABC-type molybdate transport system permease subunit